MGIPNQPGATQSFQISCPHCNRPNTQGVQFCNWCGKPLGDARAIAPGVQPPQPPQQPQQYPQQQYPPQYQQPYPPQYQQPPATYQYPPTQPLAPQQYQQPYQQQPYQQQPYPQQAPQYMQPQFAINQTVAVPPSQVVVMNRPTKSVFAAFLLTFFFGPLGLFYSTVGGALIMLLVSFASYGVYYWYIVPRVLEDNFTTLTEDNFVLLTSGAWIIWLVVWVVSIIWGMSAAASFNNRNQATVVRQ